MSENRIKRPQPSTPFGLLLVPPVLAISAPVGTLYLCFHAWDLRCPSATFNAFGINPIGLVIAFILAQMLFWLCAGLMLASWILKQSIGSSAYHFRYEVPDNNLFCARYQKRTLRVAIIAFSASLAIASFLSLDQYCLTPNGVLNQDAPWKGFHRYQWSDVRLVTIKSSYFSSSDSSYCQYNFTLGMSDGESIGVGGGRSSRFPQPRDLKLAQALWGHGVRYVRIQTHAGCDSPDLAGLSRAASH